LAGTLPSHSGDVALLRIDEDGNLLWNKTYGPQISWLFAATETNDGGYALIGNYGGIWLAKVDSEGILQFESAFDTTSLDTKTRAAGFFRQKKADTFLPDQFAGHHTAFLG
jgi:hypothetical protein